MLQTVLYTYSCGLSVCVCVCLGWGTVLTMELRMINSKLNDHEKAQFKSYLTVIWLSQNPPHWYFLQSRN